MTAHAFNLSRVGGSGRWNSEFQRGLVYIDCKLHLEHQCALSTLITNTYFSKHNGVYSSPLSPEVLLAVVSVTQGQ